MSLKEARQLVAYARKRGLHAVIHDNASSRAACALHDPAAHTMCGKCAVLVPANAWQDGRYLWSKADVDTIAAGCLAAV